jgi:hypothetical protein
MATDPYRMYPCEEMMRMMPQLVGLSSSVERACGKLTVFFWVLANLVMLMCLWIRNLQIIIISSLRLDRVNYRNSRWETNSIRSIWGVQNLRKTIKFRAKLIFHLAADRVTIKNIEWEMAKQILTKASSSVHVSRAETRLTFYRSPLVCKTRRSLPSAEQDSDIQGL